MAKRGEHRREIADALAPALRLARRLPPWNAARILLNIARLLLRYRQPALARGLIAEALAAHDAHERERRAETDPDLDFYWAAAHALAEASRPADAIRMALPLAPSQNAGGGETTLTSLAQTFAWMGDIASVRRVLRHVRTPLGRLDTLWSLADACARAGKPTMAAAAIRRMRGSHLAASHQRAARQSVAEWLAFRGDARAALAAARAVRDAEERASLLAAMAEWATAKQPLLLPDTPVSIARRARRAPVETYLAAALAAARSLTKHARERALLRIGSAAARIDNLIIARDALARLGADAGAETLAELRHQIASAEARAGNITAAREFARRLPRRQRARALAEIAASAAVGGDETAALAIAKGIAFPECRVEALLAIASAAIDQGRSDDARRQLRRLAQIVIPERARIRSEVLEAIAGEQARIGDARGAARTLLGRKDYPHVPSFASTAVALAQADHHDAALLFARRAASADEYAAVLAEIALIGHARSCPPCRNAVAARVTIIPAGKRSPALETRIRRRRPP